MGASRISGAGQILVVDGERARAEALVARLGERAAATAIVDGASDALKHLVFGDFSLVITALRLPRVDGLELLREIDSYDPDLPVILVAETDEREVVAEAVRARAFDVVWRPIEDQQLASAVARGLEARVRAVEARELALRERQRLERRSALLSVLFEEGSDGVMTWDTSGRLVDVSPSVLALTGAKLDALLGRGWVELFEPEPFGGSLEDRLPALAREPDAEQRRHEVIVRTVDGPAPAHLTLTVCELPPSEHGEPPVRWVIGVLQPPRREGLRERLRRADRLAGAVLVSSGAAHEIKNDLTPLLACLSMLEDDVDTSDDSDLAEVMREAKNCLRRIEAGVERILAPLRPQRPRRSRLDVGEVVRESVAFIRRGHPRKLEVNLDIAEQLPAVLARPDDLHQIVNNLVTNAFEAIAEATALRPRGVGDMPTISIRLGLVSGARELELCVHDTGPGIEPARQARVFEPFFTTKGQYGTGLGLTVVRDIVNELDGELTIESIPVIEGTRVCVRLPVAP